MTEPIKVNSQEKPSITPYLGLHCGADKRYGTDIGVHAGVKTTDTLKNKALFQTDTNVHFGMNDGANVKVSYIIPKDDNQVFVGVSANAGLDYRVECDGYDLKHTIRPDIPNININTSNLQNIQGILNLLTPKTKSSDITNIKLNQTYSTTTNTPTEESECTEAFFYQAGVGAFLGSEVKGFTGTLGIEGGYQGTKFITGKGAEVDNSGVYLEPNVKLEQRFYNNNKKRGASLWANLGAKLTKEEVLPNASVGVNILF